MLEAGRLSAYSLSRNCMQISHLSFADDVVIFTTGEKKGLKNLMQFLNAYETNSGQKINISKSSFLVSKATAANRCSLIHTLTGFFKEKFSFYLPWMPHI